MPSGPGFCFHSKQHWSNCGRAPEYRVVGPVTARERAQTSDQNSQHPQAGWDQALSLQSGGSSGARPGSLDLGRALSQWDEGTEGTLQGMESGLGEFSPLHTCPNKGIWQRRESRVVGGSPPPTSLPLWCSYLKEKRKKEEGRAGGRKGRNSMRTEGPATLVCG